MMQPTSLPEVIAIDVVLRPDPATEALAIRLSESLPPDRPFTLNQTDRLPHCSLFMAHVQSTDLTVIEDHLRSIALALQPVALTGTAEIYDQEPKSIMSGIRIERTPGLMGVHEAVVKQLRAFAGAEPSDDSYALDPDESNVRDQSLRWTVDYLRNSALDQLKPHITLGVGEPDWSIAPLPIQGKLDRLTLCQLGNYNTCRRILAEWPLKSENAKLTDYTPGV